MEGFIDFGGRIMIKTHCRAGLPFELGGDEMELLRERRADGVRAIFDILDQMPPAAQVDASGIAALLALAIGERD
jgi:hypothetical protein